MAQVVTINRPDIVALIERAAEKLTSGNKTEVVGLAVRRLLDQNERTGSLFGAHPGSVRVAPGVDLTEPVLDVVPDAETGRELEHRAPECC
ncbi:MAG TPA: hypothetical protein VHW66_13350 [Stellaceae bacterium]|jgi:hypothetical protein|nr:hypothetical protein [Stellaceae bacterium]